MLLLLLPTRFRITYKNNTKSIFFFKHNVYCTGAVTEGQQTSDNFHRPMLHRHKKNHCINKESINTVK